MAINISDRIERAQLRITQHLIETAGVFISLTRPADLVPDGAGAFKQAPLPDLELPAVQRYLTGLTMVGRGVNQQPERWHVTSLGERYKLVYVMVGMPDDDIQKHDYWKNDFGDKLEVIFIHKDRRYQTKAEVILLAE